MAFRTRFSTYTEAFARYRNGVVARGRAARDARHTATRAASMRARIATRDAANPRASRRGGGARRRARAAANARPRDLNASAPVVARDGANDDARALDFNACAREHAREFRSTPMSARLTREFGIGDSGTDVSLAQRLLGRDARRAHGVCDRATTEALRRWQRSRGLTPSGFFGASSRAQVATEEARWRETGGAALLERLWEESASERAAAARASERAEASGRARGVVATSTTPRVAPGASRVAHNALALVVAGAFGCAFAALRNRERFAAWTREARAKVTLDVARALFVACGARARALFTAIAADFVARREALVRAASTARARVRSAAERGATDDARDAGAPLAEGHFDENGRWWESPLPASAPKTADARPLPAEPSPRGGRASPRERAEQMRERWVNIRRQRVDVGADEREAIKRVSKFLGDAD